MDFPQRLAKATVADPKREKDDFSLMLFGRFTPAIHSMRGEISQR